MRISDTRKAAVAIAIAFGVPGWVLCLVWLISEAPVVAVSLLMVTLSAIMAWGGFELLRVTDQRATKERRVYREGGLIGKINAQTVEFESATESTGPASGLSERPPPPPPPNRNLRPPGRITEFPGPRPPAPYTQTDRDK